MRKTLRPLIPLVLALTLAPVPARAAPGAAPPVLDARAAGIVSYRLGNGFKIILVPYPAATNARIELLVKTGSKQEGYGETGMAHLLEHMLFKSAGARSNLKHDLTALGATWNGTTNAERTNFFETVAADPDKIDEAIRIEADRFLRASFTPEHLASEMTVVRNELERNDNDPSSLVMRALLRQSYFWHGYGRPTIGARSDIEGAPFDALRAFHRTHYRPDNAALIVSGHFDPERVLALAGRLFSEGRNPQTDRRGNWTREDARNITNRSELTLATGKTMAASGWRLPAGTDRQTIAYDLASTAICNGDWGSLRKQLVLETQQAVSASCGVAGRPDYSLMVARAAAGKEADVDALAQALSAHIESAAERGIDAEQLERARAAELNAFERLETSHERLASALSRAETAGDWRLYFRHRDLIRDITLDEANQALRTWTVAGNRSDVILRHAEAAPAPDFPPLLDPVPLVVGKDWPAVAGSADPIPQSAEALAAATTFVELDGEHARAALIARRTQGDLAWVEIRHDYGNAAALVDRRTACAMASDLMAYGGGGLDRDRLAARLEALQASWALSLGGIRLEAPRRNVDAALDLLLATWSAPRLPEDEFERIKAATVTSLEVALKDPAQVAANKVALRFDNYPEHHPKKPRPLAQMLAEARAVAYADVTACVADFARLAQLRLAMVGDFTPDDARALWARLERLPKASIPYARIQDLPAPTEVDTTAIEVTMPDKPNATVFGTAALAITNAEDDFPALALAIRLLGGDADSRIWKRLRERDGLAYGAGARLSGAVFEPRSRLTLKASVASERSDDALAALKEELARALRDGFTEDEVARARGIWLDRRNEALRVERSFAGQLAQGMYNDHDFAWHARYNDRIARLDAPQVNAALRKHLSEAAIVWAVGKGQ